MIVLIVFSDSTFVCLLVDQMVARTLLSTVQAAEILRVHPSTVKRWVDDGVIPASKTPGGHRKIVLLDLLRLVKEKQLPGPPVDSALLERYLSKTPSTAPTPDNLEELKAGLERALHSHQPSEVHKILLKSHQNGMSIEQIGDELIFPVMEAVGRSWRMGETDIAQEHLFTSQIHAGLIELRNRLLPQAGSQLPMAIGACPEGDFYTLGNLLAELVLLQNGWQVTNIGPNTPCSSVISMARKLRPKLVWLTCSHLENPQAFAAECNALHEATVELDSHLYLGGQALTQEVRRRLHYHWIGDSLAQFSLATKRLLPPAG